LARTFYHLKPTVQGKLNITFEPTVNNATVSGVEVLDESLEGFRSISSADPGKAVGRQRA
jgi:hypothetical protein